MSEDSITHVHINIVGPLPASRGFTLLLTWIDCTIRWPEAILLTSTMADACARDFIQDWVSQFCSLHKITSDPGAQFTSSLWCSTARLLSVELHYTSAYHPQRNGLIDCFHQMLKVSLCACLRRPTWTDELPWVLLGLCTEPKMDSPYSLAELALWHILLLPSELICQGALSSPPLPTPTQNHNRPSPAEVPALSHLDCDFICMDAQRNTLQSPYRRPFHMTTRMDSTFDLVIKGCPTTVSINHLKPDVLPPDSAAAPTPTTCRAPRQSPLPTLPPLPHQATHSLQPHLLAAALPARGRGK